MLSAVDTSKSMPLGLFHTPIYMQLAVHLHHKKESPAEVLRVMRTQKPERVNAALLPSMAWIVPAGGQMQPRCVGWQGWLHSEINSGPKVTHYKSLLVAHSERCWSMVICQRKRIIFHCLISMEIMRNLLQKLDFPTISTWRFDSFLLLIFLFSILNVA